MTIDRPRNQRGSDAGQTVTKAQWEELMAHRSRPLTDPHMRLHRERLPGEMTPDEALTVFGVAIPTEVGE